MIVQLGWLDTNIFIHALFRNDLHYSRCVLLLQALQAGRAEGWIDPIVVHELTYVLIRQPQFPTRQAVQEYVLAILETGSIRADDKQSLIDAVTAWAAQGVSFADARLAALARRRGLPICSVNQQHFTDVGNTFLAAEL